MRKKINIVMLCICSSAFLGCQNFVEYLKAPVSNQQEHNNTINKKTNSSISSTDQPIIGTPIRIGNIEVSGSDIEKVKLSWNYNYDEAINKCKSLGNGWRLPTIEELKLINQNRLKIFGFRNSYDQYWSSTKNNNNKSYFMRLGNSPEILIQGEWTECYLRVVRDIK